jgi:4-hydroxybenzoate polyprenyltransferase
MTIALKVPRADRIKVRQWVPIRSGAIALKRLWWQLSSISLIFGILFLMLGSLIFLQIHRLHQNLMKPFSR